MTTTLWITSYICYKKRNGVQERVGRENWNDFILIHIQTFPKLLSFNAHMISYPFTSICLATKFHQLSFPTHRAKCLTSWYLLKLSCKYIIKLRVKHLQPTGTSRICPFNNIKWRNLQSVKSYLTFYFASRICTLQELIQV